MVRGERRTENGNPPFNRVGDNMPGDEFELQISNLDAIEKWYFGNDSVFYGQQSFMRFNTQSRPHCRSRLNDTRCEQKLNPSRR